MQGAEVLLSYAKTAIVLTIVLTVLVAIHELGHFWFARALGMKVDAFAVMMGGRRTTDLSERLKSPMLAAKWVALIYLAAVALLIVGAFGDIPILYTIALAAVAVVIPLWIASRIATLYHAQPNDLVKAMGGAWAGAIVMLFLATRFRGTGVNDVLSLLFFASLIGILILYYKPVAGKAEDTPMGHGQLEINDEVVPVLFRPLLARTDRHGTEYSMLILPLGGFAQIKGMHPKDDGSETLVEGGFYSKSPFKRWLVLFAGPLFSVLLGIVLLTSYFVVVGREVPSEKAVIAEAVADKPAAKAGLKAGDVITSVDGVPIKVWYDFLSNVRDKGAKPVSIEVLRNSQKLTFLVIPSVDEEPTEVVGKDGLPTGVKKIQSKIGLRQMTDHVPMSFGEALDASVKAPVAMVAGLAGIAANPSRAKDEVGGTASIAIQAHKASQEGFWTVVRLAALLSISLGVMNLLPIPPLDGGQMMVAFIEMLRGGKRLSIQVQNMVATVGMFAILALVAFVMFADVNKLMGKKPEPPGISKPK